MLRVSGRPKGPGQLVEPSARGRGPGEPDHRRRVSERTKRSGATIPIGYVDSADVPYVYAFDHKHRKPPMTYKDLLGGKGANLAEMTTVLHLPVPPGFTVSTDACR